MTGNRQLSLSSKDLAFVKNIEKHRVMMILLPVYLTF